MKLYFRWRKTANPLPERQWYWQIDGESEFWVEIPDDTTTGTIAWLRSYIK